MFCSVSRVFWNVLVLLTLCTSLDRVQGLTLLCDTARSVSDTWLHPRADPPGTSEALKAAVPELEQEAPATQHRFTMVPGGRGAPRNPDRTDGAEWNRRGYLLDFLLLTDCSQEEL